MHIRGYSNILGRKLGPKLIYKEENKAKDEQTGNTLSAPSPNNSNN